jgi:hypothetical protein
LKWVSKEELLLYARALRYIIGLDDGIVHSVIKPWAVMPEKYGIGWPGYLFSLLSGIVGVASSTVVPVPETLSFPRP